MIARLARQGREILLPANVFGWLGDHLGRAAESLLCHRAWWPREEPQRFLVAVTTLVLAVAAALLGMGFVLLGWTVVAAQLVVEWVRERRRSAGRSVPARGWR
ncbi:MAG: hypothetical protein AB1816_11770 [Bacillota bacterium]